MVSGAGLERLFKRKGCGLIHAARIVAENDDVRVLLTDDEALPVSVAILAMVYGVTDEEAKACVIHCLRRPKTGGVS
jgi:hypothetical protein